jgi:hypothetical protein
MERKLKGHIFAAILRRGKSLEKTPFSAVIDSAAFFAAINHRHDRSKNVCRDESWQRGGR